MRVKEPAGAILLAGGQSNRMGTDKSLLLLEGKTLLERMAGKLSRLFDEVLIIVDSEEKTTGLRLGRARVHEDLIKGQGPLAGLYTGLWHINASKGCVLTCDMPFVSESCLEELVLQSRKDPYDACCFRTLDGRIHPFPGLYRKSARFMMQLLLHQQEGSMRAFLDMAYVKMIPFVSGNEEIFTNLNFIEDYRNILKPSANRRAG